MLSSIMRNLFNIHKAETIIPIALYTFESNNIRSFSAIICTNLKVSVGNGI